MPIRLVWVYIFIFNKAAFYTITTTSYQILVYAISFTPLRIFCTLLIKSPSGKARRMWPIVMFKIITRSLSRAHVFKGLLVIKEILKVSIFRCRKSSNCSQYSRSYSFSYEISWYPLISLGVTRQSSMSSLRDLFNIFPKYIITRS